MNENLNTFRSTIDNDEGLQSKRKLLVMVCATFLALNLTGATIEEANTFLFKIKFTNYVGLSYFFVASVIFLTLRYYSYAQNHHSKLYDYWSGRFMADYRMFVYIHQDDEVKGFLGKAISVWGIEEPGIKTPKYCISGIFSRSISYESECRDESGEEYECTKHIQLYQFNEKWKRRHYLKLLCLEVKCQLEAIFKYRENMDLLAPYLLSLTAILSFIFKSNILTFMKLGA